MELYLYSNAHCSKSFLDDIDKISVNLDKSDNETSKKELLSAANEGKLPRESSFKTMQTHGSCKACTYIENNYVLYKSALQFSTCSYIMW